MRIAEGRVEASTEFDEYGRNLVVRGDDLTLTVEGVGAFAISSGRRIVVDATPEAPPDTVRLVLLGSALALAAAQRGLLVLHASAIAIDGAAVVFLGAHGSGKSTLAAMLHRRGHAFLSDDATAVDCERLVAYPSFPLVKLWPDALATLGIAGEGLPRVHPQMPKRTLRVPDVVSGRVPLQRIYMLTVGASTVVDRLSPTHRLEVVLGHWYGLRFGSALLKSLDLRQHFLRASCLARGDVVRRLVRPATFRDDPGLATAIEAAIVRDLEDR